MQGKSKFFFSLSKGNPRAVIESYKGHARFARRCQKLDTSIFERLRDNSLHRASNALSIFVPADCQRGDTAFLGEFALRPVQQETGGFALSGAQV